MRVIAVSVLKQFWAENADSEQSLRAWHNEVRDAAWANPNELKSQFRSASILQNNRVVFNIAGNKYRLVVAVLFKTQIVLIKFIGSHDEYDRINATDVERNLGT